MTGTPPSRPVAADSPLSPAGARTGSALLGTVLRALVTLGLLAYLATRLDWPALLLQLGASNPAPIAWAAVLLGLTFFAGGLRWWLLLRIQDIRLSLPRVVRLAFVGLFFNLFLVGATGGDIIKAVYITQQAPNRKTRAALTIIVDRAMGMLSLGMVLALGLSWRFGFVLQSAVARRAAYVLAALSVLALLAAAAIAFAPVQRLPASWKRAWQRMPLHHALTSVRDGLRRHAESPADLLAAVAVSAVVILLTAEVGYWIAAGIGMALPRLQSAVILAFVICMTSLPLSIAGHGVREGAFILMFALFGVAAAPEPAVLFSVIFFLLHLVWGALGGLLYLGLRKN